jgi:hypothetical protein
MFRKTACTISSPPCRKEAAATSAELPFFQRAVRLKRIQLLDRLFRHIVLGRSGELRQSPPDQVARCGHAKQLDRGFVGKLNRLVSSHNDGIGRDVDQLSVARLAFL